VRFTPYQLIEYSGDVAIKSNDHDEGLVYVHVSGIGDTLFVGTPDSLAIPGAITSDTLWVCPVISVHEDVVVPDSLHLTISRFEDPVEVIFDQYCGINVYGQITVQGIDSYECVSFVPADTLLKWLGIDILQSDQENSFQYCTISMSKSIGFGETASGGALLLDNCEDVSLSHCLLEHCEASFFGGAIFADSTNLVIADSTRITSNLSGSKGGGLYARGSSVEATGVIFETNTAPNGGALYDLQSEASSYANLTFDSNTATQNGGAVYFIDTESSMSSSLFESNIASSNGGAIACLRAPVTLDQNTIRANVTTGGDGGAVWADSSGCEVTDNLIEGNESYLNGGGIYIINAHPVISGNTIRSNSATTGNGGGLYYSSGLGARSIGFGSNHQRLRSNESSSPIRGGRDQSVIERNSIRGNSSISGGGVWLNASDCVFRSNLIADNSIANGANGSGIYLDAVPVSTSIAHNTVVANSGDANSSGLFCSDSSPDITGCIVWDNDPSQIGLAGTSAPGTTWSFIENASYDSLNHITGYSPMFADTTHYELSDSSLAINFCEVSTSELAGSNDLLGEARITLDHGMDIVDAGACEFNGSIMYFDGDLEIQHRLLSYWPCIITNSVEIDATEILRVRETALMMNGAFPIDVKGVIDARNSIFTVNDTISSWRGMRFEDMPLNCDSSSLNDCTFEYGIADGATTAQKSGGLLHINGFHKVEIDSCLFRYGGAKLNGGAIYINECDSLSITNCQIRFSSSETGSGGGLFVLDTAFRLLNSVIYGNSTESEENGCGGGVYIGFSNSLSLVQGNEFTGNSTECFGGGLYAERILLEVDDNEFSANTSAGNLPDKIVNESYTRASGGGACVYEAQVDFTGNEFEVNWAKSAGALGILACYDNADSVLVQLNSFTGNLADSCGAAISSIGSQLEMQGNTLEQNELNTGAGIVLLGGGCYLRNAKKTILDDNLFDDNTASDGAGLYVVYTTNNTDDWLTIQSNTLVDNIAANKGGAICLIDSTSSRPVEITGNLVTWNAADYGAGLYLFGADSTLIVNNTITQNALATEGGGLCLREASPCVGNTIIWANTATFGDEVSVDSLSIPQFSYTCLETDSLAVWPDTSYCIYDAASCSADDPLFYQPALSLFSLRDSSWCVDAGNDTLVSTTYLREEISEDLHGRERILGLGIDLGCLEYYGLTFNDTITYSGVDTTWTYSYILIDSPVEFTNESSLSINPDVIVEFTMNGSLKLDSSALSIGEDCYIFGVEADTTDHIFLVSSEVDSLVDITSRYINWDIDVSETAFTGMQALGGRITVDDESVAFAGCHFDECPLYIHANLCDLTEICTITDCLIEGEHDEVAVIISSYPNFLIENNEFTDCVNVLSIRESGIGNTNSIMGNNIHDNIYNSENAFGIEIYHSYADILNDNRISHCYYGLAAANNSSIQIVGNKEEPFQQISNNYCDEIVFTYNSSPKMQHNVVYETLFTEEGYLMRCSTEPPYDRIINVEYNYWDSDPSDSDFYPNRCYDYEPTWDIEGGGEIIMSPPEELYYLARTHFDNGNYQLAKDTYDRVIKDYPESEWAEKAAKDLLALAPYLDRGYYTLQQRYQTDPDFAASPSLYKLSQYLANYCNILMMQYEDAIEWYEEIIENPPSAEDSLCAVIDIGYVYMLMQQNGSGRGNAGRFPELAPQSRQHYEVSRRELIGQLYSLYAEPEVGPDDVPAVPFALGRNYPNPFNPTTTIHYSIPTDSHVELSIYNIRGRLVRRLIDEPLEAGAHRIEWDGRN
ncbi:MAG: right-handed parallel beta-helix repeat-containing protein, partial [Actinomycetia bacterium]|nr:right-handed parallel beta-helix repeat-containing protein [Actinomycetes bacterium]